MQSCTLNGYFWNQHSLVFLTEMFLKRKVRRLSSNQSSCRVTQNAYFYENCYSVFSTLSETYSTFPEKPLNRAISKRWFRKLEDGDSDVSSKSLRFEVVNVLVEIVSQNVKRSRLVAKQLEELKTEAVDRAWI